MVKRNSIFKRSTVLLIVLTLIFSYIMPMQNAYAEETSSVVQTKICTVEEHNAHGTAPEGYEYVCTHTPTQYNKNELVCKEIEHTHLSATKDDCQGWSMTCGFDYEHEHAAALATDCQGWEMSCGCTEHTHATATSTDCKGYQFTCKTEEHKHSKDCCNKYDFFSHWHLDTSKCNTANCGNQTEHQHSAYAGSCYTQNTCNIAEHTHTQYAGACYTQKTCSITPHTHSEYAGACYTQNICELTPHTHTDACYAVVTPEFYTCTVVKKSSGVEQENAKITVTVKVVDKNNNPIPGATVNLDLRKFFHHSETFTAITGIDGNAVCKVNSEYDLVMRYSVSADGYKPLASGEIGDSIGVLIHPSTRDYTAQLTSDQYTVKFYNANDEVISEQTIDYKGCATLPANPTKEGSKFEGWNTNAWKCVTSNLDIKPVFSSITHKVTFNLNGGNIAGSTDNIEKVVNTNTTVADPGVPSISNKIFAGWYEQDSSVAFSLSTPITKDLTLYANYYDNNTANLYILKPNQTRPSDVTGPQTGRDDVGYIHVGTSSYVKDFNEVQFGETSSNPTAIETKMSEKSANSNVVNGVIEYTADGYKYTASFADIDWYVIKTGYTPTHIDGEATWSDPVALGYSITYILPDGAVNSPINPSSYNVDTETIVLQPAAKLNCDFLGWYTTENYQEGTKITEIAQGSTTNYTLYAKMSASQYSITYTLPDGAVNSPINPSSYNVDTPTITLQPADKPNYDFLGWYTTENYQEGTKITEITKGSTTNYTLYAQFAPKTFSITYVLGVEGLDNPNTITSYNILSAPIALQPLTRENYRFDGWFTSKDFNAESKVEQIPSGSTGDITLYAKWTLVKSIVKINFEYASTVTEAPVPKLPENIRDTYEIGANYSYSIPKINGYVASIELISGVADKETINYTVTYSNEASKDINVRFFKGTSTGEPIATAKVKLFASELGKDNVQSLILERLGGVDLHRPAGYNSGVATYYAEDFCMNIVYTVIPEEKPIEDPKDKDEEIDDEEVPGGEIPTTPTVPRTPTEPTVPTTPTVPTEPTETIEEEEVPGGSAELPNTAGMLAEVLYGLGAFAVISGFGLKKRNK